MHYRSRIPLLASALLLACGGSDQGPDANIPPALVGSWVAEPACAPPCAFTLTMSADPSRTLDVVSSALQMTIQIGVASSGSFTLAFSGGAPQTGTVRVSGDQMIVQGSAGTDTIDWSIEGAYLHLDFHNEFTFLDFDADGDLDPAHAAAVFEKR